MPIVFECAGDRLLGMFHAGDANASVGAVIVVGGPQYRVGSHRQFVYMARSLAEAGTPTLRFDYRSMGDAEGDIRTFEQVEDDINAAVSWLMASNPKLTRIVLIGLCDAASAISMYAGRDDRINGLVLINPWVRTPTGEARAYIKHYYVRRLFQRGFWVKTFSGQLEIAESVRQFVRTYRESRGRDSTARDAKTEEVGSFIDRMSIGLQSFEHHILILISGRDLTAREFVDLCDSEAPWRDLLGRQRVTTKHYADADHTMSSRKYLDAASSAINAWISEIRAT